MVRCITFGLLAVSILVGTIKVGLFASHQPIFVSTTLVIAAWLAFFRFCDQGKFADHLTRGDQEATQIDWPNRTQVAHAAIVGVSLLAVFVIALSCIGSLVSYWIDLPSR